MNNHNHGKNNNNNTEGGIQVVVGEILFHIVQIVLTNHGFLDPSTLIGNSLNERKSDVTEIDAMQNNMW